MDLGVQYNLHAILKTIGNITDALQNYEQKSKIQDEEDHFCKATLDGDYVTLLVIKLNLYISFVLVILGLIGNGINIFVFAHSLGKYSSSFYIFLLAFSDSLYLLSDLVGHLLPILKCLHFGDSKLDFVNYQATPCQLSYYFQDFFHDFSTALILAFTVERFIAVYKPIKCKQICTLKRTKLMCLALFVVLAIWLAPYHFIMIGTQRGKCLVLNEWHVEWYIVYTIELFLFRIIPVFTIAGFNVCIIHKITKETGIRDESRKDRSRQLTIILILISAGHVILYLPVAFHYLLWMMEKEKLLSLSDKGMIIARRCTETLDIAGSAVNFFLYSVGSSMFREKFRKTMCFWKK